jgi:hypothetical protein
LYNKPQENLHDSFLISQLEVLNACYNRENEDTVNTRDVFKSVAGNARIRFRFADKDPQGNPSNGIDRVYTNMTSFYNGNGTVSNDFVKSSSAGGTASWNSEEYLNIWVCNMTYLGQVLLLGYAFPPTNASGWNSTSYVPKYRQGVVLHYATVGRNNPYMPSNSINTAEKTAVHEVGHFLGLRHVWGDGNVSTGCFVDDFIDDTPISASASNGTICELSKNTCNTSNDLPDQIENYMDYSNGSCTNMFTKQQVALMRYNLHYLRFPISDITYIEPEHIELDKSKIFPNPSQNRVTLYIDEPLENELLHIKLYDVLGRVVWEQDIISDYTVSFDTKSVAAGFYKLSVDSALRGFMFEETFVKVD